MGKEDQPLVDIITTENYTDAITRLRLFTEEDISDIHQLTDLNRMLFGTGEDLGIGESLRRIILSNGHQDSINRGDTDGPTMRVVWRFSVGDPRLVHYAEIMKGMVRIHTHHESASPFSVSVPLVGKIERDMRSTDPITDLPEYAFGTREGFARFLPAYEPANIIVQQKYARNLQVASNNIITASRPPSTYVPTPR